MKKEFKNIITQNGQKICQITTIDERWYGRLVIDKKTGLPGSYEFIPSVTWIKSYWYTSPYLIKWIADKGLSEAEAIRNEAGIKGDKVHQATEDIDSGIGIKINDKYENKRNGELEELTVEEIEAINSYVDYVDREKPELLANEMTVFSHEKSEEQYAGTLDRIWAMGFIKDGVRQIWIIDIKTSKSIYKDMIIQVSAYSRADIDYKALGITDEEWENRKLAVLQLGYRRNKNGYKFTEIHSRYDLFKIAYQTWLEENPNTKPFQKDFPLIMQSEFRMEQIKLQKKEKAKKEKAKKEKADKKEAKEKAKKEKEATPIKEVSTSINSSMQSTTKESDKEKKEKIKKEKIKNGKNNKRSSSKQDKLIK